MAVVALLGYVLVVLPLGATYVGSTVTVAAYFPAVSASPLAVETCAVLLAAVVPSSVVAAFHLERAD